MHSALVVDSVDTVDPATGRFGLSVPIDVVHSLHVLSSPYLAQYGRFTDERLAAQTMVLYVPRLFLLTYNPTRIADLPTMITSIALLLLAVRQFLSKDLAPQNEAR